MRRDLLKTGTVLVIGDLMLDEFVWGRVRRISPEAPVPVVEVERREFYPGGAANVARNIADFAGKTGILGRLGEDGAGERLRSLFAAEGVVEPLTLDAQGLPTIFKSRIIARQQQVARVDEERVEPLSPANRQTLLDYLNEAGRSWSAVILQDYAKGLFDQELVDGIAAACVGQTLLVADPNPRNRLNWRGCHTVKPNRHEAFAAAGIDDPGHHPAAPARDPLLLEVGQKLLNLWEPQFLLLTLGDLGMLLFDRQQPQFPAHFQPQASEVFDVSGAGDTAIGFYTLALANGLAADRAAALANAAASRVVEKIGTAVLTAEEFEQMAAEVL